jgi:hypothetical protein
MVGIRESSFRRPKDGSLTVGIKHLKDPIETRTDTCELFDVPSSHQEVALSHARGHNLDNAIATSLTISHPDRSWKVGNKKSVKAPDAEIDKVGTFDPHSPKPVPNNQRLTIPFHTDSKPHCPDQTHEKC